MKLIFTDVTLTLVVQDNGRGFIPTARYEGFGLVGMEERVESMRGQLAIHSAIKEGTTLTIILPLAGVDGVSVR
jgi:signal transduction histidine kinase